MEWLRRLAVAESSLGVQLALVLIYAVFWSFALKRVGLMLQRWLKRQAFASNVIARSRRTMREGYGIYFDERAAFETTCTIGAVLSQHAAGGLACAPSVVFGANAFTTPLAIHGALCEVGWEVSDVCIRTYERAGFDGAAGVARNPWRFVGILAAHHVMGLSMVVPMNLFHRDAPEYHELVCLLQLAAFVAGAAQLGCYALTLPRDIRAMRVMVTVTLGAVLYSRVFRYYAVGRALLAILESEPAMFKGGVVALAVMGAFNAVVLYDCAKKFVKFWRYDALVDPPSPAHIHRRPR